MPKRRVSKRTFQFRESSKEYFAHLKKENEAELFPNEKNFQSSNKDELLFNYLAAYQTLVLKKAAMRDQFQRWYECGAHQSGWEALEQYLSYQMRKTRYQYPEQVSLWDAPYRMLLEYQVLVERCDRCLHRIRELSTENTPTSTPTILELAKLIENKSKTTDLSAVRTTPFDVTLDNVLNSALFADEFDFFQLPKTIICPEIYESRKLKLNLDMVQLESLRTKLRDAYASLSTEKESLKKEFRDQLAATNPDKSLQTGWEILEWMIKYDLLISQSKYPSQVRDFLLTDNRHTPISYATILTYRMLTQRHDDCWVKINSVEQAKKALCTHYDSTLTDTESEDSGDDLVSFGRRAHSFTNILSAQNAARKQREIDTEEQVEARLPRLVT